MDKRVELEWWGGRGGRNERPGTDNVTDLGANERPRKKTALDGANTHTQTHTKNLQKKIFKEI